MSTDLMIPNEMPAYMQVATSNATEANADFLDGISLGMPPSLKLKGTRFELRESDGTKSVFQTLTIPAVILAGRKGLKKSFYAEALDPNQDEGKAPDCHSDDGITPNVGCSSPQAEACAGCPNNVFGTSKNDKGEFTAGKACRDFKVLAVLINEKVYEFALPPASLKMFGGYSKTLNDRGIPVYNVVTTLGFDEEVSYPKVTFKFGGWMQPDMIAYVEQLRASNEVLDVISPAGRTQVATSAPAIAAPVMPATLAVEPIVEVLAPEIAVPAPVAPPVIEVPVVPAPVAPPVIVVPAAPVHVMTAGANGFTYEQMIANGWTDALLISEQMMEAPVVAAPVAPAPPAVPTAPIAPVAPELEALEPGETSSPEGGLDSRGVPWGQGVHADNKAKKNDGSWKARRNGDPNVLEAYEAQFLGKPPVAAAAPMAPPLTVAAAPVAPTAQPVATTDDDLRNSLGL